MNDTYTRELARWIAGHRFEDTPADVIERLKLLMLDSIGCGIFGSLLPWSKLAIDTIAAIDGNGTTSVWGTEHRMSPPHAALLNGTFVQGFELDDVHMLGIQHSGATVIPAALAVAEHRGGIDGRRFLAGAVCGYETVLRVGQCLGPRHMARGWQPAGTNSPFAAAAAVGNILGLLENQMVHALGLAGNRGVGLEEVRAGAMDKRMLEGKGSQQGVYAALLAEKGFTGIKNIFEAEKGFCTVFSGSKGEFDLAELTRELGQRFDILTVELKAYAANASTHTPYDAIKQLQQQRPFKADEVEAVHVWASTLSYGHTNAVYKPESVTYAQFCIPYGVAVTILEGDAFVDQYTEEKIRSPQIIELAKKVTVSPDPEIDKLGKMHRHQTRTRVTLKSGEVLEATVEFRRGSIMQPLTEKEIIDKFQGLALHVAPQAQADRIVEMVLGLEKTADVAALARLLATP